MAKKKKKKKGDKTPYVHIDILPEEEQLPDASIAPETPPQPQAQPVPGARGQRMNDPRRRGEGFEPYAAEVVSASGKGLSKKKADGKVPVTEDEDSDVTPFVIPVFRKSDSPQQGHGMHPMQQRMYGTAQFPPVGGGAPNGNPRQNLTQIQQNLLNHHNVARQQAAQRPGGPQPSGHQMGQSVNAQSAQPMQQGGHLMGQQPAAAQQRQQPQQQMRQGAAQARQKQNTGQFAPVQNQLGAQQPHQVQQPTQARGQANPTQQNLSQQVSQPLSVPGAMQAVASAAAARANQSRATAAQGAIQAAAQAQRSSQQGVSPQAAQQIAAAAQQAASASQAPPFQQRQAMPVTGQASVQGRPVQGGGVQAVAGAAAQSQTTAGTTEHADDASEEKGSKPLLDPKAAEDSPMFDKPPVSIEEGMRKSTSGHKTKRRVIIVIAILIVLLGGGSAAYMILSEQGVVPRISIETATVPVAPQDSANKSSANNANNSNSGAGSAATDPGTTPDTSSGNDLAGTVVYQYTANTASGVEYKVEETVTFQSNGDCQSSTMNMTFPDAASAKTFTDNLARDYGTSFKLDSLNGNNAVVTIDNSGLHLTRDEYENALRYSVSDLVVNK